MSEHESIWQKIEAWWHLLWHHAQAGTLPDAPVAGGVPVTIPPIGGTITPPAPPIPVAPAVDHGVTPPSSAGATGSLVGQPVPGGDMPDANGTIAIPAIATKFPPSVRFLTMAALPFVAKTSAQAFTIAANCGNVKFLEGAFVNVPDFSNYKPLPAVENPASAVALGGPAFHLHGQAPGETVFTPIPNCVALASTLTTMDEIVAYCSKLPDFGSQHPISPVAGG